VNPLNEARLTVPVLGCFHLLGFILFVGTTAVVDFRLLGLGMRPQEVADLAKILKPWSLSGLAMVLLSGPLLFTADPEMFYQSRPFQVKMICLVLAIAFHSTVHRKAISAAASGAGGRIIGCASLALWTGVIAGGIFMGFA
jgi:hypothetical protein